MQLPHANAFRILVLLAVFFPAATPALRGQVLDSIRSAAAASPTASSPVQAQSGSARRLSLDDAVGSALEQNLSIRVERMNPAIQDLGVAQVRALWAPNVSSQINTMQQNNPPSSFLSGGQVKVTNEQFGTVFGINQLLPWGASYSVSWDSSRSTTNNVFTNFNPVLQSNVAASFTQPLARNFRIDTARQQLLITKKNREISDVQLRQIVVATVRNVKNAYWDLVYAIASLETQRQSLDLSRELLRNNRTRVQIGTMAPIDIIEAEAEVARNEETVIVAEAALMQAEDGLRALIFDPSTPDFWNIRIEPADTPVLQTKTIDAELAVRNALDKRTDLLQARKSLESSDVNIQYYGNQILPDVNLQVNYGLAGVGGTQLVRDPAFQGFPAPIIGESQRRFGSVLGDIFTNDFPSWTVGVTIGYPIGENQARVNLARAKMQHTQAEMQIRNLELQVSTQVRDLARQATTNAKRVDATRASTQLAERRLEAEQKKFGVGMSTSFLVMQAQRDLAQARNNELKAILDYNRSLVDFEAVQEAAIGGSGSITIAGSSTATAAPAVATTSAAVTTRTASITGAPGR